MPRHEFEVDENYEGDGTGGGNLVIRIVCLLRDLCALIGFTVPELAKRRKVDERTTQPDPAAQVHRHRSGWRFA